MERNKNVTMKDVHLIGTINGREVLVYEADLDDEAMSMLNKNKKIFITRLSDGMQPQVGISFEPKSKEICLKQMGSVADHEHLKAKLIIEMSKKIKTLNYIILGLVLIIIASLFVK